MRVYLLTEGARANRTTARKPGPLYFIQYFLVTLQLLSLLLSQAGIIWTRDFFKNLFTDDLHKLLLALVTFPNFI
jgi:hypothetical protein